MNITKTIFSAVLLFFIYTSTAQVDDHKNCVTLTNITVYKAQKQMISNHSTEFQGKLAKIILLQSNAIYYLEGQNKLIAICYSLLARKYALEIIQFHSADNKVDPYYLISEEEKKLSNNCLDESQLLKQGKNNFPNYSENDKDYLDPLILSKYL